ncbi:MAG TPA: 4'-phosphopantetheinyl transferase superfamily protein [Arachidicoccus soli]|nr:4'-phosphopantetheinyl transferase superfamily protein [Arachidicoccus soli]
MFRYENINYEKVVVHLLYFDDFDPEEYAFELLASEREHLATIKHIKRKREYIATRLLRNRLFGKKPIIYSEIGAPSIKDNIEISISHTNNIVGIACCREYSIGLDIEQIQDKVLRVKNKFLSRQEKEWFNLNSMEEMTKVWSGKEALYKLAGRKRIIFSENLNLFKRSDEVWEGNIVFKDFNKKVLLSLKREGEFIISTSISRLS